MAIVLSPDVERRRDEIRRLVADGTAAGLCPPLNALLQVMMGGERASADDDPALRAMFRRDALHLGIALSIEPRIFAIQQEQLARRRGVVPPHAPRLAQHQRPALRPARFSLRCIRFMKKDLQRLRPVVTGFHALEKTVQTGIGGKRRNR